MKVMKKYGKELTIKHQSFILKVFFYVKVGTALWMDELIPQIGFTHGREYTSQ
jgi:hypothetical protein